MRIRVGDPPATSVRQTAGQVPVEHDDVVGRAGRVLQRVGAVEDDVDGHARPAKTGRDDRGQLRLVLDHQHPHRAPHFLVAAGHPGPQACPAPGVQDASAAVAKR